jgi:hypothetical protein
VFDFDAGSRPKDRDDDQELLAAAVTACFSDALMTPNGCRTCDRHELARCSFAVDFSASALLRLFDWIDRVSQLDRCNIG